MNRLLVFLIHNSHLDLWGIQQNELYKYAHKNTCRLFPYSLQSVCATLNEMSENLTAPLSVMPEEDLLVLTNQSRIDGAACILYDNMLEKIAEVLQEDFYVIPSSIHELLILRKTFVSRRRRSFRVNYICQSDNRVGYGHSVITSILL